MTTMPDLLERIGAILERHEKHDAILQIILLLGEELPEGGERIERGAGVERPSVAIGSFPAPPLHNLEDARAFLEEELPEWLGLAESTIEAGEPLPSLLLMELGYVAPLAARVLLTGKPAEVLNSTGTSDLGPLARMVRSAIEHEHCDDATFLTRVLERAEWCGPGANDATA